MKQRQWITALAMSVVLTVMSAGPTAASAQGQTQTPEQTRAQTQPLDQTQAQTQAQAQAQTAEAIAKSSWFKVQPVDDAWRQSLPLDAKAATQAYMDRIPTDVLKRSNDYYEGGYWLQLWHLLLGLVVAAVWMSGRRTARVRDWATRVGRGPLRRDFLFSAVYLGIGTLVSLPLTAYEEWWREHAYNMATQTLGAWMVDWTVASLINLMIGAVAFVGLYALMRRARQHWWAWGAAGAMALLTLVIAISPVVFEPMFNTYKPVEDGPLKQSLLRMAHATGVPASDVLVFDASRQTTKVSANVSGLFGTAAIRLNDNLLRRTTEPEIRAVTGHEIGHYVLNHIPKMLLMLGLVVFAAFLVAKEVMNRMLRRTSSASGVDDVADIAGLPLLMSIFSVFFALATPITNTMIRVQEAEADQFGLALSREPLAFAEGQLRLVEYRKADPGALEEVWFYSHPSTRARIFAAMRWREAMNTPANARP